MSIPLSEIRNQAMGLGRDDRLALIRLLWDSLARECDLPGEQEALALAVKRAGQLDSGQIAGAPHQDVMNSLDRILDEARLSSGG